MSFRLHLRERFEHLRSVSMAIAGWLARATLNGRPAGEAHLFGKVAQQTAEGRVRAGVELERDRGEVAVVKECPQLGEALASDSEQIDASREALGIDGSRTAARGDATATTRLLRLVGVRRGSTVAEAGRSGIASDQQRMRMVEWVLLLVMTGGHSVRMMRLLLRDTPGTVAPGGGGGRGWVLADRFAEAAGAGDHLPAPDRK